MTLGAAILMTIVLVLVWGGLGLALLLAWRNERRTTAGVRSDKPAEERDEAST